MTVYLVGAGPGDPGLLTVRGAELLHRADVVVYDRLVDARLLELAPPTAKLVDVGKRVGDSAAEQQTINEQLVDFAKSFSCVVRLKGGDPYVFGRGGEEAQALADAKCAYEVVSGVSSFVAAPAAAGVPLTMRGVSSSFIVVTGHDVTNDTIDWKAVARSRATIVVLMGVGNRAAIAKRLIDGGLDDTTPVLVVENGTTARQRSMRATLGALDKVAIESPATILIGQVAGLSLTSYEDRPLAKWRVVVTQDVDQSGELSSLIELAGGEVINVPTIEIVTTGAHRSTLREALGRMSRFDWVVFSSKNAVESVMAEIRDARSFGIARVAAIGSATARLLAQYGVIADYVPSKFVGETFVDEFPLAHDGASNRVLLPRAADGRDVIEIGLRDAGWEVEVVDAYETVHPAISPSSFALVKESDLVTFTSSSAVDGLLGAMSATALPKLIACIGPIAAATAREHGLEVAIEATEHTVGGLVAAIIDYAKANPGAIAGK